MTISSSAKPKDITVGIRLILGNRRNALPQVSEGAVLVNGLRLVGKGDISALNLRHLQLNDGVNIDSVKNSTKLTNLSTTRPGVCN